MRIRFLFLTLLCGCARPNYVNSSSVSNDQKQVQVASCSLTMSVSKLCVSMAWQQLPSGTQFGSFVIKTFHANQADGSPVQQDLQAIPTVFLWMPGMNHGAPAVQVDKVDLGTYQVSHVFFTMKGHWEIHLEVKNGDVISDETVLPFDY